MIRWTDQQSIDGANNHHGAMLLHRYMYNIWYMHGAPFESADGIARETWETHRPEKLVISLIVRKKRVHNYSVTDSKQLIVHF